MKSEFIPYEQALVLKELGFDEPCFGNHTETDFYDYKGGVGVKITKRIILSTINGIRNYNQEGQVSAPTFSQAFRWFREKYKGVHEIVRRKDYDYLEFIGWVYIDNKRIDVNSYWIPLSYEEAELACLKKLIEIVKSK
jgi:hypothetical protein